MFTVSLKPNGSSSQSLSSHVPLSLYCWLSPVIYLFLFFHLFTNAFPFFSLIPQWGACWLSSAPRCRWSGCRKKTPTWRRVAATRHRTVGQGGRWVYVGLYVVCALKIKYVKSCRALSPEIPLSTISLIAALTQVVWAKSLGKYSGYYQRIIIFYVMFSNKV